LTESAGADQIHVDFPVSTELDNFAATWFLPGLPGGLDQPFTRAPAVDEQVA
jgi:hypothetical protein